MKKRASDDLGPTPRQLVNDVTDGSPEGVRATGPTKKRLKAIVCEARGAAEEKAVRDAEGVAQQPACATKLQSLCAPARLRSIDGESNFLLYKRGAGSDSILIPKRNPTPISSAAPPNDPPPAPSKARRVSGRERTAYAHQRAFPIRRACVASPPK